MTREQSIPLFLWVATAIVAHAIGGGGATEVSRVLDEKHDITTFARSVRRQASLLGRPVEVALLDEESPEPPPPDAAPTEPEQTEEEKKVAEPELAEPQPVKKPEEKKKEEAKKLEEKKKEEEKKETLVEKKPAQPVPPPTGRIAVQQHAKENQEDNPTARYAAEQANHTDEETRARVTSTDQNAEQPSPGGKFQGAEPEPGNSNDHKVAQSEESKGEKGLPPDAAQPQPVASAEPRPSAPRPAAAAPQKQTPLSPSVPRNASQTAQTAQTAQAERAAALEAMTGSQGRWGMPPAQNAQAAQAARKKLPEQRSNRPTDLLGYGSTALTARGVNLNLSPQMVVAVVGADRLAMERRKVGERRLSQHRGSWKSLGLERWRPALENYVATVKPGNQTNLNTAHVPFSRYLNEIHSRIHPVFAEDFLSHLNRLPAADPLNNPEMSTHLEVQLSGQDGRVMRLGITKSSGITAFDVGALDSVQRAGPYGVPPNAILSSDGNVYLHWEFHRRPELACSTYFARPFILNIKPESAPPRVEPPPAPTYDAPAADERTGALDPSTHDHAGSTGDAHHHEHPPG